MFKSKPYKQVVKKMLKDEGHSNSASVLIRLKSSKERDYLIDTKKL